MACGSSGAAVAPGPSTATAESAVASRSSAGCSVLRVAGGGASSRGGEGGGATTVIVAWGMLDSTSGDASCGIANTKYGWSSKPKQTQATMPRMTLMGSAAPAAALEGSAGSGTLSSSRSR